MEQNRNKYPNQPRTAARSCLCCGEPFAATSPYLRVCPFCKASEEWQSGNVDIVLNATERKAANDN